MQDLYECYFYAYCNASAGENCLNKVDNEYQTSCDPVGRNWDEECERDFESDTMTSEEMFCEFDQSDYSARIDTTDSFVYNGTVRHIR